MSKLKSFKLFRLLKEEYFSINVRHKKSYVDTKIFWEHIVPGNFSLFECLNFYKSMFERDDLNNKGIRFIVVMDFRTAEAKCFILIWTQEILHNEVLQTLDNNSQIINPLFDKKGYKFYRAYMDLSIKNEKPLGYFVFPGTLLKGSSKIVSNFSAVVINQMNNEIIEQSKNKYDLRKILKYYPMDYKSY